ncbi:c-type cytochrome [Flavihumibacter profundi]|uniref:c-type cytochrome n=1 Tax=Flavihumibacter profundi TaxID=2716883 RepID=UPI001CC5113B|nr:c-type cytochrome [Flavihumibacter profundi]MBZ5857388.1 c-type cytochrome [Flavihumibacter profundi]
MKHLKEYWLLYLLLFIAAIMIIKGFLGAEHPTKKIVSSPEDTAEYWQAPSLFTDNELDGEERELVIYGEDLVANTSRYFGPKGIVKPINAGMNCQNCHLNAGKLPWGNNYGAVYSTYPKYRDRSGSVESITKRVNDCFERSLNGETIDTNSHEMKAFLAYMKWIGQDVKKGEKPKGSGINDLPYMDRAASPEKGGIVYKNNCQTCHGTHGEGLKGPAGISYTYPPLWGENSFNIGAGLYRISRLAGYARDNMPFGQSSHNNPKLTTEEAWDVAAFINSQPRPFMDLSKDWPDISKKPIDHPFGPFTDGFTEKQHKYGPFQPIADARKKAKEAADKSRPPAKP